MISFLRGKILNKFKNNIILEVNNIGYKVFLDLNLLSKLKENQELTIYTYLRAREDALDLYGFQSLEELNFFELLLSVSGVGPKSALGVLSASSINDIKNSISNGDPVLLIKVSGIGRKTAERIILELREKITQTSDIEYRAAKTNDSYSATGDEIDALMALGYSMQQARDALRAVSVDIKDSGERIKEALRTINN